MYKEEDFEEASLSPYTITLINVAALVDLNPSLRRQYKDLPFDGYAMYFIEDYVKDPDDTNLKDYL